MSFKESKMILTAKRRHHRIHTTS